eukprot:TRINITY_DN3365_c0_g2_i6.p1 TRINITY_DN3365_c0_g2~~TRINITY_DN3365_c0_g2_i6.p1  ORF type:complete len:288 (-),score=46.19 TRINITY_DN3365_c0_g2_i6:580-1443(-)
MSHLSHSRPSLPPPFEFAVDLDQEIDIKSTPEEVDRLYDAVKNAPQRKVNDAMPSSFGNSFRFFEQMQAAKKAKAQPKRTLSALRKPETEDIPLLTEEEFFLLFDERHSDRAKRAAPVQLPEPEDEPVRHSPELVHKITEARTHVQQQFREWFQRRRLVPVAQEEEDKSLVRGMIRPRSSASLRLAPSTPNTTSNRTPVKKSSRSGLGGSSRLAQTSPSFSSGPSSSHVALTAPPPRLMLSPASPHSITTRSVSPSPTPIYVSSMTPTLRHFGPVLQGRTTSSRAAS